MAEPTIVQKEPFAVEVEEGKSYWWCACGLSKNQPYCDGSHQGSDFVPVQYDADKSGKVFFCGCKKTEKSPMCDGTHAKL